MDLYITIAIIGIGIFLFVKDYFSIDTTSILIMALFIVSGVLNPEEGFSGFNHPATITLGCMFVVSAAVFKSGLIDGLSSTIVKVAKMRIPEQIDPLHRCKLTPCFERVFRQTDPLFRGTFRQIDPLMASCSGKLPPEI